MTAYKFNNVSISGMATYLPEDVLTSAEIEDKIAHIYKRLGIPFGTLERLSGVASRRMWPRSMMPSTAGAEAAKRVLKKAGVDAKDVGAIINCSVCRDMFEPSTACIMHAKVGLASSALAFDVSNACIGFSNGLMIVAQMIETGVIEHALVVSAENPAIILDSHFQLFDEQSDTIKRAAFLKLLPTFTLGCGAVAFLVSKDSSSSGLKFIGGVAKTGSEHALLCSGNGDFCLSDNPGPLQRDGGPIMETESSKLIPAAAELGGEACKTFKEFHGWDTDKVEHVVCHQVGKQINEKFYQTMGLAFEKDICIYQEYGNMVSAALPATLSIAEERGMFKKNEKIILTAFGSGLHAVFSGVIYR